MQTRKMIILLALFSFVTGLWLVAAQRQQLAELRAARTAAEQDGILEGNRDASLETNAPGTTGQVLNLSPELLQLRSQVTLLSAQVRGLNFVTQENARLRGQLAAAAQNTATGIQLPPGYVRKNQARLAGYKTPEDTLQSFFYGHFENLFSLYTDPLAHAGEGSETVSPVKRVHVIVLFPAG